MSIKALQDYTYVSRYARYNKKARRRETWTEAVDRVKEMHLRKYPQVSEEIEWAFEQVRNKRVLGSQRALQFGGKPIEQKNARIYNCLAVETEFITSEGVRSFADFADGDECVVLTHKGNWKLAVVRSYGKQNLHRMTISRGRAECTVRATNNHRWLLKDGTVTQAVSEEDQLMFGPNVAEGFVYEASEPLERLYWAYGYVYGDGTLQKDAHGRYKYSQVRLCGEEVKYLERFRELGFGNSTSASLEGDVMVYTGKYLKTLPDPKVDAPNLIRAFVHGYLAADGIRNSNARGNPNYRSPSPYDGIQATGEESVQFIRDCFPIAGVYIVSEEDLTGQVTNYGEREELTVRFRIISGFGKTASSFTVSDIDLEGVEEDVWCLEVEDDQSFVLPNGLVTGNCCVSFCDRIRMFQETFWLLLCGCGTGFSVQKHHIAKLPAFFDHRINANKCHKKVFTIPDSIEGWSDALGILLATYMPHEEFGEWLGYEVEFDYHLIRPAGSVLASGVGKAPGPDPLRRSLEIVRTLLKKLIAEGRTCLRPIDAYDIIMHASDAVLSGGVRRSATICLFSPDDDEMATAKIGNWFMDNPQRARSNNSALLIRNKTPKEQFVKLMKLVKEFGEPGFVWADSPELCVNPCVEIGMWPVHWKTGASGWQMCVSGDTKLLLESGRADISSLVGKKVKVWNGEKWSEVIPFITGHNRELFRVHLSDGSFLDCTENHRWLVKNRFQKKYTEIETKDLMSFSQYQIHTPRANVSCEAGVAEPRAYDYGFMLGDGTARYNHAPSARLYKGDRILALCGSRTGPHFNEYGTEYENFSFSGLDNDLALEMKSKDCLPDMVFSWNKISVASFVSGWVDADGTKANNGCRLYGTEGRLRDAQILLTKIGINSSVNLMAAKGERTNKGVRNQDVWYLQIPDARKLTPGRIDTSAGRVHNGKGKFQIVRYVECLPGLHTTYCVTEPELHQCLFNNVLTKQCNLCEINGRKIKTKEDFVIAAKAGAIIGTLQAGYTDFDYLGQTTKEIVEREALLGVSITGMMDNPDVIFDQPTQREMARYILEVNEEFAKRIGIRPAARATCVKPAGTTSCILGSASGIHPHHAKRYFRRIQGNYMEAPLQYFKQFNPLATEKSVWSANKTDEVITFCIDVPDGAKTKNQLSAVTLLEYVKETQQNWVAYGKRDKNCTQPWLTHNVSNTISVRPEEWDDVTNYIYDNRKFFAGIALLPTSGDLDYPQAPMCTVHSSREIVQIYGDGSLFASGLIVDGLRAFDDNLWAACDAINGVGDSLPEPMQPDDKTEADLEELSQGNLQWAVNVIGWKKAHDEWMAKKDFVRCGHQFAARYFNGDVKLMTYCLKEIHNWKLWQDLTREYKDVDYSLMIEETDETKPAETIACGGGQCELR